MTLRKQVPMALILVAASLWPVQPHAQVTQPDPRIYELRHLTSIQRSKLWLPSFPSETMQVGDTHDVGGDTLYEFTLPLQHVPLLIGSSAYTNPHLTQATPAMLRGEVVDGHIAGLISTSQSARRPIVRINTGGFHVTLHVERGRLASLYGGTLQVNDTEITITNSTELVIRGTSTVGTLAFGGKGLSLRDAQVSIGDGLVAPASLRGDAGSGFTLDLGSNDLRLVAGTLSSTQAVAIPPIPSWKVDGLEAEGVTAAKMTSVRVSVDHGRVVGTAAKVRLKATSLKHDAVPKAESTPADVVSINQIEGLVPASRTRLAFNDPAIAGLSYAASTFRYFGSDGSERVSGAGSIDVQRLTDATIDGRVTIPQPSLPRVAAALSGVDARDLVVRFKGPKSSLQIDGELSPRSIQMGALSLRDLPAKLVSFTTSAESPIAFHIRGDGGKVSIGSGPAADATAYFEGALSRFAAAGQLDSAATPPLTLLPGSLSALVSNVVTPIASLLGGMPQFADNAFELAAPAAVTSNGGQVVGDIELRTGKLTIPGSHFKPDPSGGEFVLDPIASEGAVTLGYDLAKPRIRLESGRLTLAPIRISQSSPFPVTIGELTITSPSLEVGSLSLQGSDQSIMLDADSIAIGIGTFKHDRPPRISGTIAQPVTVASAHGVIPLDADRIDLTGIEVHDARLLAGDIHYDTGDGVMVNAGSADLRFMQLSDKAATGGFDLSNASVAMQSVVEGSARINRATFAFDGPKDAMSGNGHMELAGLHVVHHSGQPLISQCSTPFHMKLEGSVGPSTIDVKLANGKPAYQAGIGTINAGLVSEDDDYRCEWDSEPFEIVHEVRISFPYPCGFFSICTGWTILVPRVTAQVHWLAEVFALKADVTVDGTQVRSNGSGGLALCGARLTRAGPVLIAASYHPTYPDTHNVFLNIPRDLLRGAATLLEGSIASITGTSLAAVVTLGGGVPLAAECRAQTMANLAPAPAETTEATGGER